MVLGTDGVGNLMAMAILTVIAVSIIISSYLASSSLLSEHLEYAIKAVEFERVKVNEDIEAVICDFKNETANVSIKSHSPFPVEITHVVRIYDEGSDQQNITIDHLNITINPGDCVNVTVSSFYPENTTLIFITENGNSYKATISQKIEITIDDVPNTTAKNVTIKNLYTHTLNITCVLNVTYNGTVDVSGINLTLHPGEDAQFFNVTHRFMRFYCDELDMWFDSPPINVTEG